MDLFAYCVLIV